MPGKLHERSKTLFRTHFPDEHRQLVRYCSGNIIQATGAENLDLLPLPFTLISIYKVEKHCMQIRLSSSHNKN